MTKNCGPSQIQISDVITEKEKKSQIQVSSVWPIIEKKNNQI